MNPVQKNWMFVNWMQDQVDKRDLAKDHAYLIGSFINPEAVNQMAGTDNKHISSDEDLEESMKMVRQEALKDLKSNKVNKRKRKRIT